MTNSLKQTTKKYIELNNFEDLTKVQNEVLKYNNSRNDLFVMSKTGTGKTHAYLIPIMEMINPKSDKTQVVISLPTRELAYQVNQNCKLMKEVYPDLRIQLLLGGTDKKRSISKFNKNPHIVIGTPGRISDLFTSNVLRVDYVQMFVIDEADMTLEFGFLNDIDRIFSHMVKNPRVLCFSATLPEELRKFINVYLNKPKMINITDSKNNPRINHTLINCKHKEYKEKLYEILNGFNPYICIIFANTKDYAKQTYDYLNDKGIKSLLLHGGLEARTRQKTIKDIQTRKYKYIIATDVASRGIDIEGVSHIVSLGLPKELQFYVHRAGRTGRNNSNGICYLLYKDEDLVGIKQLNKNGIKFESMDYKNGTWKKANNPTTKKVVKFNKEDKELISKLTRKKEKVKPNYKKKKKIEIEKIKRKKRREFIKNKIKEERKERYKSIQRNKKKV